MSDFLGGYAARRANAFLLTTITHVSGTLFVVAMALATHAPLIEKRYVGWAMAAGLCGGLALAIFYRALSTGNMGVAAPVGAVLARQFLLWSTCSAKACRAERAWLDFCWQVSGSGLSLAPKGGRMTRRP
jgi:hypothetical protein